MEDKKTKIKAVIMITIICLVTFAITTTWVIYRDKKSNKGCMVKEDKGFISSLFNTEKDSEYGYYFTNMINIHFKEGYTSEDVDAVVSFLEGEIVVESKSTNFYSIEIVNHSYDELEALCESIKETFDCVKSASVVNATSINGGISDDK